MKLSNIFCSGALVPALASADRDAVIRELVTALDKAGKLGKGHREEIIKAVIKRENEASTGMGKGIAVPHVKHPAVKKVVAALGLCGRGINFASLDKQDVHSVILLVSPADDPDQHLRAMEAVFRHLQAEKFRKFLRQCQSSAQIADLLREADDGPSWL